MTHVRLLLAALATACAAVTAAQAQPQAQPRQVCRLTIEQSPSLRGFRLGMSLEQLKARVPGAELREGVYGFTNVNLPTADARRADPAAFEGVSGIFLGFLDGRLVSLSVQYDERVPWKSAGQFASRVSELLKLPDAWRDEPADNFNVMECAGFNVRVTPNQITLVEPGFREVLRRRQDEREEEARKRFRP